MGDSLTLLRQHFEYADAIARKEPKLRFGDATNAISRSELPVGKFSQRNVFENPTATPGAAREICTLPRRKRFSIALHVNEFRDHARRFVERNGRPVSYPVAVLV